MSLKRRLRFCCRKGFLREEAVASRRLKESARSEGTTVVAKKGRGGVAMMVSGACAGTCCEERTRGGNAWIGAGKCARRGIVIVINRNLSLYRLFVVIGFYRHTFPPRLYAGFLRHAYACHLPPGGRNGACRCICIPSVTGIKSRF